MSRPVSECCTVPYPWPLITESILIQSASFSHDCHTLSAAMVTCRGRRETEERAARHHFENYHIIETPLLSLVWFIWSNLFRLLLSKWGKKVYWDETDLVFSSFFGFLKGILEQRLQRFKSSESGWKREKVREDIQDRQACRGEHSVNHCATQKKKKHRKVCWRCFFVLEHNYREYKSNDKWDIPHFPWEVKRLVCALWFGFLARYPLPLLFFFSFFFVWHFLFYIRLLICLPSVLSPSWLFNFFLSVLKTETFLNSFPIP